MAVALPCLGGLTLALLFSSLPMCRLEGPERVSVAVETCYQNVGVATAVAISMFDGDDQAKAVGVPLYYGFVEALLLAIFCVYAWKAGWTLAPASAEDVLRSKKKGIRTAAVVVGGESHNFGAADDGSSSSGGGGGRGERGLEEEEEETAGTSSKGDSSGSRRRRCSLSHPSKELQAFAFILSHDYQQERPRGPDASSSGGGGDHHPSHDAQQQTTRAGTSDGGGDCDTPHASSSQQQEEGCTTGEQEGKHSAAKTRSDSSRDNGYGGGGSGSIVVAVHDGEEGGKKHSKNVVNVLLGTKTAKATITGGST